MSEQDKHAEKETTAVCPFCEAPPPGSTNSNLKSRMTEYDSCHKMLHTTFAVASGLNGMATASKTAPGLRQLVPLPYGHFGHMLRDPLIFHVNAARD